MWGRAVGVALVPAAAIGVLFLGRQLVPPAPRICKSTTQAARGNSTPGQYHWAHLHGPRWDGASTFRGPQDLASSLAWSWQHPQGRYYTLTNGIVIDDEKYLYLGAQDALRKFSPDGALLWTYCLAGGMPGVPSLMDGALFSYTETGFVFSLDMHTGQELWKRQHAGTIGGDTSTITAYGGVLLLGTDRCTTAVCAEFGYAGGATVRALSARDGRSLWSFTPDAAVWNFVAIPVGDGNVAYQDLEGRMYCHRLHDGKLLWKKGGHFASWNDGSASFWPDASVLFSVTTHGPNHNNDGHVTAYRATDGEELWRFGVPNAPNQFASVGPSGDGGVAVVVSEGPPQNIVECLDAATGKLRWRWVGPDYPLLGPAGDRQGAYIRSHVQPNRVEYAPNIWGNPLIDAHGTVFIGHTSGWFFSIRDANGDGHIDDVTEVSRFNAEAAFPGSSPAMAPGLLAVASTDTLLVFRAPLT